MDDGDCRVRAVVGADMLEIVATVCEGEFFMKG